MLSRPLASLPVELIESSISFLQEDIEALKLCSQAFLSSDLSALPDRWLYKNIDVHTDQVERTSEETALVLNVSQLTQLLNSHEKVDGKAGQNVGVYIEFLCITLRPNSSSPKDDMFGSVELVPFLQPSLLPSLRALEITTVHSEGYTKWHHCHERFREALLTRLEWTGEGTIGELSAFQLEGLPLRVLEGCQGLKRLHLEEMLKPLIDLPLQPGSPLSSDTASTALSLDHLSIYYSDHEGTFRDITAWCTHSTSIISNLRSLVYCSLRLDDYTFLLRILERCTHTLEELTIDLTGSTDVQSIELTNIPFHTLQALRKLTIDLDIQSGSEPNLYLGLGWAGERWSVSYIQIIGQILANIWNGGDGKGRSYLTDVNLKVGLHMSGSEAPSLAEMASTFEPLLQAFPSPNSSQDYLASTPVITFTIVSAKQDEENDIPFDTLLADLQQNEVMSKMIKDGKMKVVDELDLE